MPLPDLKLATQAIAATIRLHMAASPIWAPRPAPVVSPRPPDEAGNDPLTLFLYHIGRDGSVLNRVPPNPEIAPHFTPLGLVCAYQLAAHAMTDDIDGALDAQLALSAAMLALNEHQVLTSRTTVAGTNLFADVGVADPTTRMNITLLPIGQSEAVGFWTPGDMAPRLAAYYQVAVQLMPPAPRRTGARVLSYSVGVRAAGAPNLTTSENSVTLVRPGGESEDVTLRPALVSYGETLRLIGDGLTGDHPRLILTGASLTGPVRVGVDWSVQLRGPAVEAVVQRTAGVTQVPPGLYAAQLEIERPGAGGATEVLASAPVSFTIAPAQSALAGPDGNGRFTVTGQGFAPAGAASSDAAVMLGGSSLTRGAGANPAAGEFVVDSDTGYRFAAPATMPSGSVLPLRFVFRGATSLPLWVTVP
ncbi:Pvc16 family protein [Primorskyibacter sp. 2E107]|uniref:Pvc16 family protein n=1 Tax=Primorskyibacter sp. 2E107 TaxID=3403458 RepID=UPI003AF8F773